jgi:hypothetical protein
MRAILQSLIAQLTTIVDSISVGGGGDVPVGGVAGDVLKKDSGTDFDTSWTALGALAYASVITTDEIQDGTIVNADVNAAAAIAWSKLNTTGQVVDASVSASAAIARSKLDFGSGLVNADIAAAAAIAYSKLALTGSIVNADVNASAAIAWSKISANQSVTGGATGDILIGTITNANVNVSAAIAYGKLNLTGAILNADLAGSIALSKLSITGTPDGTKFLKDDGSWAVPAGAGDVPAGGVANDLLIKDSGTDYDTSWAGPAAVRTALVLPQLDSSAATVTTAASAAPQDLFTYTLPAGTIASNEEGLIIEAWGDFQCNSGAPTWTWLLNAGAYSCVPAAISPTTAANRRKWFLRCVIHRSGSSGARLGGVFVMSNTFSGVDAALQATNMTWVIGSSTGWAEAWSGSIAFALQSWFSVSNSANNTRLFGHSIHKFHI